MHFGFTLPNNWGIEDAGGVVALAPFAESAGFDSVWVNHHLLNVGYVADRLGGRPYHDAMTTLTWAAATTRTVELGTSVLVLAYLNPFVLAKAMATLDQLSQGRVRCGVGVGSLPAENDVVGVVPYGERGRYVDEALAVMRALWDEDDASFQGEYFSFASLKAAPKPWRGRRLPVAVGGNRNPALRRAARFGDCWHGLGLSAARLSDRLTHLDGALAALGRTREDIVVSLRLDVRPDSTPDQLIALFDGYRSVGVDEMVLSLGSPDLEAQRRLVADVGEHVIPALR